MYIVHLCFRMDVWLTLETTEEARIAVSVERMQAELYDHYRELRPFGHKITEVQQLTPGMFGAGSSQSFNMKAAESNWFVPYVRKLIRRNPQLPNAPKLATACDSLIRCQELTREHPLQFPPSAIQDTCSGKYVVVAVFCFCVVAFHLRPGGPTYL